MYRQNPESSRSSKQLTLSVNVATLGNQTLTKKSTKGAATIHFHKKSSAIKWQVLGNFPVCFSDSLVLFLGLLGVGCLGRLGRLGCLLCLRPWRCRWRLLGADLRSCSCPEAQLGVGELLKGCNPWSKNGKGWLFVSKISQSLDVFLNLLKCWFFFKYRSASKATPASMF